MKKLITILRTAYLTGMMMFFAWMFASTVNASEYYYTVKIHLADANVESEFVTTDGKSPVAGAITVTRANAEAANEPKAYVENDTLYITNLCYNDRLTLNSALLARVTDEESKYYIKGIRKSGANDSVSAPSFLVTKDVDYVLAYGVGTVVPYRVYYLDQNGDDLFTGNGFIADTEGKHYLEFYGPKDQPLYVSYLYKEGYVPDAYNKMTSSLKAPEYDENGQLVSITKFTFNYRPGRFSITNITERTEEGGVTVVYVDDGTTTTTVANGQQNAAANNGAAGADGAAQNADNADNQDAVAIEDEAVPEAGPEEVISIDDEQVPLNAEGLKDYVCPVAAIIIVAIAIATLVLILINILPKKKRSQTTTESSEDKTEN